MWNSNHNKTEFDGTERTKEYWAEDTAKKYNVSVESVIVIDFTVDGWHRYASFVPMTNDSLAKYKYREDYCNLVNTLLSR